MEPHIWRSKFGTQTANGAEFVWFLVKIRFHQKKDSKHD